MSWAAVVAALCAGSLAAAEAEFLEPCVGLEVVAAKAPVRLAGVVVGEVERGRRFGVREDREGAYQIQVFSGRTLRHGWIDAKDVRVLSDGDVDLALDALRIAKEMNPAVDVAAYGKRIDALAARVTESAGKSASPQARFQAISRVLFHEERLRYRRSAHALDGILDQKQGNCLGLSVLYLAVSRELKMPLCGVSVPKHAFLRYDDGTRHYNIEPSMGGILVSDAFLQQRYHKAGGKPPKLLSHLELTGLALSQAANELALADELERAHRLFARASELAPRNGETYHNWGTCLLRMKKFALAADMYLRSVDCEPNNTGSRYSYAVALSNLGQHGSACKQFERVVKDDPRSAEAWYNWGITLLRMRRVTEANEKFARAIALKPQYRPIVERMQAQVRGGDFDNRTWAPTLPR